MSDHSDCHPAYCRCRTCNPYAVGEQTARAILFVLFVVVAFISGFMTILLA